jgi:hypothetical protein
MTRRCKRYVETPAGPVWCFMAVLLQHVDDNVMLRNVMPHEVMSVPTCAQRRFELCHTLSPRRAQHTLLAGMDSTRRKPVFSPPALWESQTLH